MAANAEQETANREPVARAAGGARRMDDNCTMSTSSLPTHPRRDLWYGSPVRLLIAVALAVVSTGCRAPLIQNLPLQWTGVDTVANASPSVAHALASVPFSFGVRDVRPDPTVVGSDVATGHVIRTSDNVAQYTSSHMGELLRAAGARFDEPPVAAVEIDLTEFNVAESGKFNGAVGFRVTVRRGDQAVYSNGFRGDASTWGKSHSPANFNKVLSSAIDEATEQLLQDEGFAAALMGEDQMAPPAPVPAPAPAPVLAPPSAGQ